MSIEFQQIADELNRSCKGLMLNDFGSGEYLPWTHHDVQIGVNWCHKKNDIEKMCSNCQNIFFKLYTQMVKRYGLCQTCERNVVLKLSEKDFKYQNYATIENVIRKVRLCENCSLNNIPLKIVQT